MKPNLIPCIFKGHTNTQELKLTVFYMEEDHHNEHPDNVLIVGMPKYTETGMQLEYYEEKSN